MKEMDMEGIKAVLPHREPFLWVDLISDYESLKYADGIYHVKEDEFWAPGHFPKNPVFPGVLILECMAQVGGFVFIDQAVEGQYAFLSKVDDLKYCRKISVGEQIDIHAEFVRSFNKYAEVDVIAKVEGKKAAHCKITYTFMNKL